LLLAPFATFQTFKNVMDDHRQRAVERDAERLLEEITRMEFDVLDINGAWGAYPDPIAGTGIDAEPVVIRQKQVRASFATSPSRCHAARLSVALVLHARAPRAYASSQLSSCASV
jgi:hypothetical protein